MDDPTGPAGKLDGPRVVMIHDELRYAQGANQVDVEVDGLLNYHWLMSPADLGLPGATKGKQASIHEISLLELARLDALVADDRAR